MMLPSVLTGPCCTCQTAVPGSEMLTLDLLLAQIRIGLIEDVYNAGQFKILKYKFVHI